MNSERDTHYNGKERLERYRTKVVESTDITQENRKLILDFYELCKAQGLSNARLAKTLWQMRNFGIWIGKASFLDADKNDVIRLINIIQEQYPASPLTVSDYKVMLKKFYKHTLGKGKAFPEVVEWVDSKPTEDYKIDPSQIFTEDDIIRILAAENAPNNIWSKVRNKALIIFLYDAGVRVGELLSMKIGDMQINSDLWHITVRGKTGQRTFPVFPSIPYLKEYLSIHPRRDDKDAFVWCSFNNPNHPISYQKVVESLKVIVRRAGIRKPSNPHNFRHSAVTRDAVFMSDQELKMKYGWTKDSSQLRTYSHIRTEHLDDAYRKRYKLDETADEPLLLLKLCPSCHAENKPHEKFCAACKKPLGMKEAMESEKKRKVTDEIVFDLLTMIAEKNPEVKEAFRTLVKSKGLEDMFK